MKKIFTVALVIGTVSMTGANALAPQTMHYYQLAPHFTGTVAARSPLPAHVVDRVGVAINHPESVHPGCTVGWDCLYK